VTATDLVLTVTQILRENHLGQELQVYLVDNAGGRGNHAEAPEGLLAPAQELIALAIALKLDGGVALECAGAPEEVHLHGVIDHEVNRNQRIDLARVATQSLDRRSHGSQVHDGGHSRKILQDDARGLEGNFPGRRRLGVPLGQRRHIALRHQPAVAVPQQCFQQDFDRERQAGYGAVAGLFQAIQAIDHGAPAGGLDGGSRSKSVLTFVHCPSATPAYHNNAEPRRLLPSSPVPANSLACDPGRSIGRPGD